MNTKKLISVGGAVSALAMLTTACGTASHKGTSNGSQSAGSSSQVVKMDLMTEPPTLNPAKAVDTTSGWVMDQVMEGLTYAGKNNKPQPGIAKSWKVSDGGKVYTFHLRNAKWSNGDAVTAGDFAYALKHVLNPKTGAQFASYLYYIKGAKAYNTGKGSVKNVGIQAVDAHTLKITLANPTPFFLSLTTFWPYFPVDQKVAQKNPNWYTQASTYVSDGPFKLASWQHQQKLVLEKNNDYWNKSTVHLSKIDAVIVNDNNTQYQMYRSGQLTMDTSLPLDVVPKLIKDKKAKVYPFTGTYFLEINTKKAPFNNVNIRKAFGLSINRTSMTKDVLQGGQIPAYGAVPPGIPGNNGQFRKNGGNLFKENVAEAKKLLAKGLQQEGLKKLPPVTFDYNTSGSNKKIAEALQQMWSKNLGVKVNLRNEEWKVYLNKLKNGNYQFGRMGWIDVYADPSATLDLFKANFGSNYTGWKNQQYTKLVQEAESTTNKTQRFKEMHQAEKILIQQMPMIPIYFYTNVFAISNKLQGYVVHPNWEFPDLRSASIK
ncbi:peptide ABC transporter substrate-binding protein [Alicyclobacillus sp. SO9]|uniref:peptide ABC transporter substrate-binding protein n=1 Tax=Alicyclobacillus sp. SO9 TaxID=2665646 RepID=UPI0018E8DA9F|nr:peptide ABC transporter substrate-binding protein [Alicyclobacillus sp. SO9]QQE80174.1 peptide ABC transporter substrate-binding protein [Alicyclobacillus sp. SO9]